MRSSYRRLLQQLVRARKGDSFMEGVRFDVVRHPTRAGICLSKQCRDELSVTGDQTSRIRGGVDDRGWGPNLSMTSNYRKNTATDLQSVLVDASHLYTAPSTGPTKDF